MDPNSSERVQELLAGRIEYKDLAAEYKTNVVRVKNHINEHMTMALRPAMRRIMLNPDTTKALVMARAEAAIVLTDKLALLSDRINDLNESIERAQRDGNMGLELEVQKRLNDTARTLQGYLREIGVWTGDIDENIININIQAQYIEFKQLILGVLSQHPEVLAEVEEKLKDMAVGD